MTRKHIVICDKCRIKNELEEEDFSLYFGRHLSLPKKWECLDGKDLCPKCAKEYKKFLKKCVKCKEAFFE